MRQDVMKTRHLLKLIVWREDNPFVPAEKSDELYKSSSEVAKLHTDFGKNKPGMATISLKEYCGNEKTEELYKQGGHGADVDAKVLCLLSTSKRMYNRFFSFFALDKVFGVRRNSYSMRYLPF
jgi:hypothetical protein